MLREPEGPDFFRRATANRSVGNGWELSVSEHAVPSSEVRKRTLEGTKFKRLISCMRSFACSVFPAEHSGKAEIIRSQMLYPLSYERWCPDSRRHLVPGLRRAGNAQSAQRFKHF